MITGHPYSPAPFHLCGTCGMPRLDHKSEYCHDADPDVQIIERPET